MNPPAERGARSADPKQARPEQGPGRPRVLTEAEVIDAALALARESGIARLSMRAVARQLGVPPMTIYGYVPNKATLEALVIDRILSEVAVPNPDDGTWEHRLEIMLCDARRILVERPSLADGSEDLQANAMSLLHGGALGHEATRLANAVFDMLRDGGFAPDDTETCFVALFTYVTGYASTTPTSDTTTTDRFAIGLRSLIEGLKITLPTNRAPDGVHQRSKAILDAREDQNR